MNALPEKATAKVFGCIYMCQDYCSAWPNRFVGRAHLAPPMLPLPKTSSLPKHQMAETAAFDEQSRLQGLMGTALDPTTTNQVLVAFCSHHLLRISLSALPLQIKTKAFTGEVMPPALSGPSQPRAFIGTAQPM